MISDNEAMPFMVHSSGYTLFIERRLSEMAYVAAGIFFGFVFLFAILIDPFFGSILGGIVGIIVDGIVILVHYAVSESIAKQKNERETKREFDRKHPHLDAENFYRACWKAGARSAKTEASIAKINACAKEQGLLMTQEKAIELFLLGQSEVKRIKDEEQQDLLAKLTEEEKEYEEYITRFSKLSPHEKVKQMCREQADEYREKLEFLKDHQNDVFDSASKMYQLSKRKEYDWATMGGIASGLGGLGAGVAVAIDAQIKNAEIRQQNEGLQDTVYTMAAMSWMENIKAQTAVEEDIEYWEQKEKKASKRKVKEGSEEKLLSILSPSVVHKTQNKTGSIVIKVQIEPYFSHHLRIGKNPAVIDGTIKAVFWKKDTRVGEAVLTLPLDNCGYSPVILEGICRSKSLKYKENYTITFEPNALWLIEESYVVK